METKQALAAYRKHLTELDPDELDNEDYTYKYESHWLDLDTDTVGDRLVAIESEKQRRAVEQI